MQSIDVIITETSSQVSLHMIMIIHRSDSIRGPDYIAILVSLISDLEGQNFKI